MEKNAGNSENAAQEAMVEKDQQVNKLKFEIEKVSVARGLCLTSYIDLVTLSMSVLYLLRLLIFHVEFYCSSIDDLDVAV